MAQRRAERDGHQVLVGDSKPAAGLLMLREKVLGSERFALALQEYSKKWMFKHPQPADLFRTLASGAGERLDYFCRGWFYSTYNNDPDSAYADVDRTNNTFTKGVSTRPIG